MKKQEKSSKPTSTPVADTSKKMNSAVKKKWVAALKSDDYEQGKGHLNQNNKFCCLGVLCDLYIKEIGSKWEVESSLSTKGNKVMQFDGEYSLPPDSVVKWAGLSKSNPELKKDKDGGSVIVALINDTGSTFKEISDLIDKQL